MNQIVQLNKLEHSSKIFLIGFMGSGKTTLGKRLANKLNKLFFDLDAEIERIEKNTVSEIFDGKGEEYFRKLETETLIKLIDDNENFVLSLGGGTPCFYNNMELVNQSGTSIYLKYNAGMLTSRLINAKTERPLIKGLNVTELNRYISNKLIERELFYNQSKIVVKGSDLNIEDILSLIQ